MPFPTSNFVRDGKYVLLERQPVGCGGLGQVYHAYEVAFNREVAVKEVLCDLDPQERQFAHEKLIYEATIHSALNHPRIVQARAFEYDSATGEHYLVCDFIGRGSLAHYIEKRRLPEQIAINLVLDLLDALDYLHKQGIVHRDIKPSNILVAYKRSGLTALLIDFGIAWRLQETPSVLDTDEPVLLTPEYCAPEQHIWDERPDPRSDLYAVGLVLGEIVCGGGPYKLRQEALYKAKRSNSYLRLRHQQIAPRTSKNLARIIDRATEEDPDRRFQTAAAFSTALKQVRDKHTSLHPFAMHQPFRPGRALVILSIILLLIGLPFLGFPFMSTSTFFSTQPSRPIQRATVDPAADTIFFHSMLPIAPTQPASTTPSEVVPK